MEFTIDGKLQLLSSRKWTIPESLSLRLFVLLGQIVDTLRTCCYFPCPAETSRVRPTWHRGRRSASWARQMSSSFPEVIFKIQNVCFWKSWGFSMYAFTYITKKNVTNCTSSKSCFLYSYFWTTFKRGAVKLFSINECWFAVNKQSLTILFISWPWDKFSSKCPAC